MLILAFLSLGFSQEEVNYEEEYLPKLQKAQEELANTEASIVTEEGNITDLNTQVAATEEETVSIWDNIYSLVGSDKNGVDDYRNNLNSLLLENPLII